MIIKMAHIKDRIIYDSATVKVYINQCIRNPKFQKKKIKTNVYAIRRDDVTGLAHYIGGIKWSGRWRQYVFEPEAETQWSMICLKNITIFLLNINADHRNKLMRKKKSRIK